MRLSLTILLMCLSFTAPSALAADVVRENLPKPSDKKDAQTAELQGHCARHYTGMIQGDLRTACTSASPGQANIPKNLLQTRCRLEYGDDPRLVMACLIGAQIVDDVRQGREDFKKKLQLCAEHYPVHTEIDSFLMESCLTGIHLPQLMKVEGKTRHAACGEITPERSFIGPCAVGVALAQTPEDAPTDIAPAKVNQQCEQYFDHRKFHSTYRACLTARSLGPQLPEKASDAVRACGEVVSDAKSNTERAACFVGAVMYRSLARQQDISKRFQKCGDNKVSYQDRDFLACLVAAGLSDWPDKSAAQAGCREVYTVVNKSSRGRQDCLNSLNLF